MATGSTCQGFCWRWDPSSSTGGIPVFPGTLHVFIRLIKQNTHTQEHLKVTSDFQPKALLTSFALSVIGLQVTEMCLFFPSVERDTKFFGCTGVEATLHCCRKSQPLGLRRHAPRKMPPFHPNNALELTASPCLGRYRSTICTGITPPLWSRM